MLNRAPALILLHFVWSTYRRRRLLPPSLDERLANMLGRKALEVGCSLLAAGCADDHVHVVVRLAARVSLSTLVQRMKGASSHELRADGTLPRAFRWQERYWARSICPHDVDPVLAYVRRQRQHHAKPTPPEPWTLPDDT